VTLQLKGIALSDLCDHLRADTGIELSAGPSVADEKVTVFCDKTPLRSVMRQLSHAFGYTWLRSGKAREFKYELEQDLRSQLLEEELRNRDRDAALLALDGQMQQFRPYLGMSFEELKKRAAQEGGQAGDTESPLSYLARGYGWGAVQLYDRLTARDRTALMAGEPLVFRSDASDPDRRLPAEWNRQLLLSMGGSAKVADRLVPWAEVPGAHFEEIRLRVNRSELGQVSLAVRLAAAPEDKQWYGLRWESVNPGLVTARSPSAANPENAAANTALRGHAPFDRVVSLRPKPSCPAERKFQQDGFSGNFDHVFPLAEPHVFTGDVWEAVHRATGLPIIADYYTHLYPLSKVTVEHQSLFEALCKVGEAMDVRWRKDGDFLVCRSASFFWDRLKEVPNRYLQHWAHDRDANGGLPLTDFLEMAGMSGPQLDADAVGQGIEHFWGLREWAWLRGVDARQEARCLALLSPEQLRRAQEPDGLPFNALAPAQQQAIMRLQYEKQEAAEQDGGPPLSISPEEYARSSIIAFYLPAGSDLALVAPESESAHDPSWVGPCYYAGGRTESEAIASAHRRYPRLSPQRIRCVKDGFFNAGTGIFGR
jgi:hypothetical protein